MRGGETFADRADAGRRLGLPLLSAGVGGPDVVVLGLPRGGVPVAAEVARVLHAPLDVLIVRKVGVPSRRELAMGAIGEGGVTVLNQEVLAGLGISPEEFAAVAARERDVVGRRLLLYRQGRTAVPLDGRTALVVDDGIATGSTARAACRVARARGAARVVLATPVAPPDRVPGLERDADEVVCLETPSPFYAVGQFYRDFSEVTDDEVTRVLAGAGVADAPEPPVTRDAGSESASGVPARDEDVRIGVDGAILLGHLRVPTGAHAVVVFAHGSGSSRLSPRNRFVADVLGAAGLGTLLFDLLTPEEERDRANVFDIALLAERLSGVTRWLYGQPGMSRVRLGYFGASTGAAAALWAASQPGSPVAALVSRGGRPDLAAERLGAVRAPTLLIVGSRDGLVLGLNRQAESMLRCESRLAVVPGATHLFEEPGTLVRAAELARDWFLDHLGSGAAPAGAAGGRAGL